MNIILRLLRLVLLSAGLMTLSSCQNGDSGSTTIGATGGTLTTQSGNIQLTIPANALSSDVNITIAPVPSSANLPPGNMGNAVYDPTSIPQGIPENDLTLAFVSGSTWTDIPTTVDTLNKLLIGQTTHFSYYGYKISDTTKLPYGTLTGIFNGVNVYSNGCADPSSSDPSLSQKCISINNQTIPDTYNTNNAGSYNSGLQWQSVEYVNRYYHQVYANADISIGGADAKDYWSLYAQKGLDRFPNGGSVPPQIGDVIVSVGNGAAGNVGHVAIVKYVTPTTVHVVQQNFTETVGDLDYVLSLSHVGNSYTVSPFAGTINNASYPVTGWLRLPTPPPVSTPTQAEIEILPKTPTTLDFGNVSVGSCSSANFAIQFLPPTDSGSSMASGTVSVGLSTSFSITSGDSFSVQDGSPAIVTVQFCPTDAASYTDAAIVTSNATFVGANWVSLSGTVGACTPTSPCKTEYGNDLPTDFPTNIPIEGATLSQSFLVDNGTTKQLTIVFQSMQTVQQNYGSYVNFLTSDGWSVINNYNSDSLSSLYGIKPTQEINITISSSNAVLPALSQVSISVLLK